MIRATLPTLSDSELIAFLDGRADEALSARITEALVDDPILETRLRGLDGGMPEVHAAFEVVASRAPVAVLAQALAAATAEHTGRQSAPSGIAMPTLLSLGAVAIVLAFAGGIWVGMAWDSRPIFDPAPLSDRPPSPESPSPARAVPADEPMRPARPPQTEETTVGVPVASGPASGPSPVTGPPTTAQAQPAPVAPAPDAMPPATTPPSPAPAIAEAQPAPVAPAPDSLPPATTPPSPAPAIAEAQPAPVAPAPDSLPPATTPPSPAPAIAEAQPAPVAPAPDSLPPATTPPSPAPAIAEAQPAPAAPAPDATQPAATPPNLAAAPQPQREVVPWVEAVANYVRLMTPETLVQTAQSQRRQRSELAVMSQRFDVDLAAVVRSVPTFTLQRIERLELNGRPLLQLAFVDRDGLPVAVCIILRAPPARGTPVPLSPPVFRGSVTQGLNAVHWDRQPRGLLVIGRGTLEGLKAAAERIDRAL